MDRFFDTHCHLYCPHFDADREAMIVRAEQAGVAALTAGTCLATSRVCAELAARHAGIYAAVGIHPCDAGRFAGDWDGIRQLARMGKVIAIGETGLDYYHKPFDRDAQLACFDAHIALARELTLPLLLHARDSATDVLDRVEPFLRDGGKAVWHCFSAPKRELSALLDRALGMGLYLGITALITFDDQKALQEIVKRIPDRHLLLDTDAPYLVPRPREADRNEPAFAVRIAERLAQLRGVTLADVARITTRNACDFLGLELSGEEEAAKVAYPIRNSLYLALTNGCNNNCAFCARNQGYVVKGHNIRLDHDPSAEEVIAAMGDISTYDEVVFCGFGEPTLRMEVLMRVAEYVRGRGKPVRLNTNGLANLEYGRDVVPELARVVDTVSISLNTADPAQYQRLCRSRFGDGAHAAVCDFIRTCVASRMKTVATVVEMPDIDVEAARALAAGLGAEFRVRSFVDAG